MNTNQTSNKNKRFFDTPISSVYSMNSNHLRRLCFDSLAKGVCSIFAKHFVTMWSGISLISLNDRKRQTNLLVFVSLHKVANVVIHGLWVSNVFHMINPSSDKR